MDRGQGREIDFHQIRPDPGVIAAQGGWDEGEDSEDHVPLTHQWVMRSTQVQNPASGEA